MSENELKSTQSAKHGWHIYIYTAIIFLNFITIGINTNIYGPAMVDMTYIYDADINFISLYSTFLSGGYVVGSLCGFLFNYVNRQLLVIILVLIASIASILIIFCPNLSLFFLCFAIIGVGSGVVMCANSVWVFELWPQYYGAVLQFSSCTYGIGAILSTFIIAPYLTGDDEELSEQTNALLQTSLHNNNNNGTEIDRRSLLEFPLILNGVLTAIGPILLTAMFVIKKYEYNNDYSVKTDQNMIMAKIENKISNKLIITLFAIIISSYATLEFQYFVFSATFSQYSEHQLSATKSAQMLTAFTVAFTVGRAVSSLVAIKVKPQHMILFHYTLILLALLLMIFTQTSLTFLWINNILLGYGCSAIYCTIYALAENSIEITNNVATIFTFFTNFTPMFPPFVLGLYIESHPLSFIYFELVCLIIALLTTLVLLYLTRKQ